MSMFSGAGAEQACRDISKVIRSNRSAEKNLEAVKRKIKEIRNLAKEGYY